MNDTIIEIEGNLLVCDCMESCMVFLTFCDRGCEALELTAFCYCSAGALRLDLICTALHTVNVREEIFLTHLFGGMTSHTVAVCEYLECSLL